MVDEREETKDLYREKLHRWIETVRKSISGNGGARDYTKAFFQTIILQIDDDSMVDELLKEAVKDNKLTQVNVNPDRWMIVTFE